MFTPTTSAISFGYLTRARMPWPCAAITSRSPARMAGAMRSFQQVSTRALQRAGMALVDAPFEPDRHSGGGIL
jgi:hypothetical protein